MYVYYGPQISTAWVEQNQLIGYNQGTEVFRTAWLPALDGEYLRVLDNGHCFAIWVTPGAFVSVYGTSDVSGGDDEELECAAGFDLVLLDHLTEYLTIVS